MPEPSAASCSRTFQSTLPTRGSDPPYAAFDRHQRHFNPRSPRGGATHPCSLSFLLGLFQSTLPTRGSDPRPPCGMSLPCLDFNPRSPRGGATLPPFFPPFGAANFNPRSPRGGATPHLRTSLPSNSQFQSTLPTRGSDQRTCFKGQAAGISIHAPHEGERLVA